MKTKDVDLKTVEAVDKVLQPQSDTATLSSGVVLRGKQANPLILVQVMAAFPRPEPPLVYMQAMGREVENPDDPDYIERLQSWKMEYSNSMVTAMITLGTELESKPKKMPGPDDDEWLEEFSLLGLPTHPQSKSWRYLMWVKFQAIKSDKDMELIKELVGRLSGVRESTVRSAESFSGSDKTDR